VGGANACLEDCATATSAYSTAAISAGGSNTDTCPDGLQEKIDDMYSECGGCEEGGVNWDEQLGPNMKTAAEAFGCGGAAQTVPLAAALATVVNHFLN
jgi:hypothetical protein